MCFEHTKIKGSSDILCNKRKPEKPQKKMKKGVDKRVGAWYYSRALGRATQTEYESLKNFQKSLKKSLTNEIRCDKIVKRSTRVHRTLKIKQRKKWNL